MSRGCYPTGSSFEVGGYWLLVTLELELHAEVQSPPIVLLLQDAIGDALIVAEQRVVQVERVEVGAHVARQALIHGEIELAVGVVEAILQIVGADHVDVRAVEVDRYASAEAGLLVGDGKVADVLRLTRQRAVALV